MQNVTFNSVLKRFDGKGKHFVVFTISNSKGNLEYGGDLVPSVSTTAEHTNYELSRTELNRAEQNKTG